MPIQSLHLRNLLSFKDAHVDFRDLTVLIGANASGKSNLISSIGLLRGAAADFQSAVEEAGGSSLIRKVSDASPAAALTCKGAIREIEIEYQLAFRFDGETVAIETERLCLGDGTGAFDRHKDGSGPQSSETMLSGLRKYSFPAPPSEFRRELERIRIYRGFDTGPGSVIRQGARRLILRGLKEDGSNLAAVFDRMQIGGEIEPVERYLRLLLERFREIKIKTANDFYHVVLAEQGLNSDLPASRVSDGTLRFLCLLAALFDSYAPWSPVCIEEPEAGLHPDALRLVAEALLEASLKRQIIVTTHSEGLVDALSSQPESVVICERDAEGATQFRRLDRSELSQWLDRYSLGEIWRKGEIGGNRW